MMRLYFFGSKAKLALAMAEDWYSEWSIGFGRGVQLRAVRPVTTLEAVVVLNIPDFEIERYARGFAWPGEFLVPASIVRAHDASPK